MTIAHAAFTCLARRAVQAKHVPLLSRAREQPGCPICVTKTYKFETDWILSIHSTAWCCPVSFSRSSLSSPHTVLFDRSECEDGQQHLTGETVKAGNWKVAAFGDISAWVTGMSFRHEDSLWRLSDHMSAWHLEEVGDLMGDYLGNLNWP